jgi:CelD/BcsL family acetyltransferase involved in cellulose biosynthesis
VPRVGTLPRFAIKCLNSLSELSQAAPAWNDLWQRSDSPLPLARAEFVASWCQAFAPDRPFRAVVIEDNGQWVAALPWIDRRWLGLPVAVMPGNHWSAGADLLVDEQVNRENCLDALVAGLVRYARSVFIFDAVPTSARPWQDLLGGFGRAGLSYVRRLRYRVNQIDAQPDWDAYWAARSRNHRRHVRRSSARADAGGALSLVRLDQLAASDVESVLRNCFEL